VNGWVFVHLEGTAREVGFQNGYHLAAEIDDALQMFGFFLEKATGHDWAFFREAASRMFWPKANKWPGRSCGDFWKSEWRV